MRSNSSEEVKNFSVEDLANEVNLCLAIVSNRRLSKRLRTATEVKLSEVFAISSERGIFKSLVAKLSTNGVMIGEVSPYLSGVQLWTLVLMSAEVANAALSQIQARNPKLSPEEKREVLSKIRLLDTASRDMARRLCLRAPVAA